MANCTKDNVNKDLIDSLGVQGINTIANMPIKGDIQPVFAVSPKYTDIVKNYSFTNSANATLYNVVGKTFYLTYISMNTVKDATAVTIYVRIYAFIGGVETAIATQRFTTLTAEKDNSVYCFPFPIKIDKNTNITVDASNATGNFYSNIVLGGFYL